MRILDHHDIPQTRNIINVLNSHKQDDNIMELHIAVTENKVNLVEALIQDGVPLNSQTKNGITSLLLSCLLRVDTKIPRILIQSGADVNIPDMVLFTPLLGACLTQKLEIVQLLLQSGANINHQDDCGYSALHYAIENENIQLIEILLHSGIDTSLVDCNGWNALMMSLHEYNESFSEKILSFTDDVNTVANNGWSALMLAALNGTKSMIFNLVERGADVNINVDSNMPVVFALDRTDPSIFEYLWDHTNLEKLQDSDEFFNFIESMIISNWILPDKVGRFYKVLLTPAVTLSFGGFFRILGNNMLNLDNDDFESVDVCGIMTTIFSKGAFVTDVDVLSFISICFRYTRLSDKYNILEVLLKNNADFNSLYYIELSVRNDPDLTTLLLPLCISVNPIDVIKYITEVERLDIPMLKLLKFILRLCTPSSKLREECTKHLKSFDILKSDFIHYSILISLEYQFKEYVSHHLTAEEQTLLPILYHEVLDLLSKDRFPTLQELARDQIRKCLLKKCFHTSDYLQGLNSMFLPQFMTDIIQCKAAVTFFE